MSEPDDRRSMRHWVQFRLSTLLLMVTIFCVWLGLTVPAARRQRAAVEAIREVSTPVSDFSSARIEYDYQFDSAGQMIANAEPFWPAWLLDVIGYDFFYTAVGVNWDGSKNVVDADLSDLSRLPYLTRLDLEYTAMTDEGLKSLGNYPKLVRLDLQETKITGSGLRHIAGLKNLEYLMLGVTAITDEDLVNLKDLSNLRHLALRRTQIAGEGLRHLAGLRRLESLDLRGNPLTDVGMEHIKKITSLRELTLTDTLVTESAVEELRKVLVGCKIDVTR